MRQKLLGVATHPWLAFLFRLYLGGIFVYASMNKISYVGEFANTIASYQLVPYFLVNVMAVVLPWVELIAGLLLIVGVRAKAATVVISGLLGLFTLAIAINLFREMPIGCGCFHTLDEPINWKTLVRDLVWFAMSLHVLLFDNFLHLEKRLHTALREVQP